MFHKLFRRDEEQEGEKCARAADCAIAKAEVAQNGGEKVYRATYCAHTSPLPLLPSGPGGVGGITSRRTRHMSYSSIPIPTSRPPPSPYAKSPRLAAPF